MNSRYFKRVCLALYADFAIVTQKDLLGCHYLIYLTLACPLLLGFV